MRSVRALLALLPSSRVRRGRRERPSTFQLAPSVGSSKQPNLIKRASVFATARYASQSSVTPPCLLTCSEGQHAQLRTCIAANSLVPISHALVPSTPRAAREVVSLLGTEAGDLPASGTSWRQIGHTKPTTGRELVSDHLSRALAKRSELSADEWKAFGITGLAMDHYIKADSEVEGYEGAYYSPAVCMLAGDFWYNSRPVEDRGWPTFEVGAAKVVVAHLERAERQGQLRGTHYTEAQKTPKLLNSAHIARG